MSRKIHINELFNMLDEIFLREKFLKEALDSNLKNLLGLAKVQVFDKFGIKPDEKKYFIAGSAKLYTEDALKSAFGSMPPLGDLDIIIPDKNLWDKAGLGNLYNSKYEPSDKIEVFSEWNPSKAGEKYANLSVRNTNDILNDTSLIGGYYFMPLADVTDYKLKMGREKEEEINMLSKDYEEGGKIDILKKLIKAIGPEAARGFLKEVNKRRLAS